MRRAEIGRNHEGVLSLGLAIDLSHRVFSLAILVICNYEIRKGECAKCKNAPTPAAVMYPSTKQASCNIDILWREPVHPLWHGGRLGITSDNKTFNLPWSMPKELLLTNSKNKISKKFRLQHQVFPGGHPSKYWRGPIGLNFGDLTRTGAFPMVWP